MVQKKIPQFKKKKNCCHLPLLFPVPMWLRFKIPPPSDCKFWLLFKLLHMSMHALYFASSLPGPVQAYWNFLCQTQNPVWVDACTRLYVASPLLTDTVIWIYYSFTIVTHHNKFFCCLLHSLITEVKDSSVLDQTVTSNYSNVKLAALSS